MYIKYDNCGDNSIVYVPDTAVWKICFMLFGNDGNEVSSLYLIVGNDTILLRDTDYWLEGRPNLRRYSVEALFAEIIDVISAKIENDPNLKVIDIPSIESKLIKEKYEKEWNEKGWITVAADGSW